MIKLIERKKIDEQKWDKCVESNNLTASVFARLWYIDACCENWCALVEDDYQAVMPLFWRKKYGIVYIYPPFFLAQLGILGNPSPNSDISEWIKAIPSRFRWIELIFNAYDKISENNTYKTITHRTYILSLKSSYEDLRSEYHQNHKRNLRKAESANLTVINNFEMHKAIDLFRSNRGKDSNVGYKELDYERLLNILNLLDFHNALESYGVLDDTGELCAAAFFTFMFGRYTFLFSGRSKSSDKSRAMFYLIDKFIQSHSERDCILDFNGSNNEQVAKFYAGFDAYPQQFIQVNLPFWRR